jgi:hypothetical protein
MGEPLDPTTLGEGQGTPDRPPAASSGSKVAAPGRLTTVCGVAALLAVALGVALRTWFLFHDPISSDEAVAGLIARQILHGHTYAFFWGQPFGGVEPYVVAAFFWVFGQSGLSLVAAPPVLSAVAAVLVWRVARRLVDDPALGYLAGALAWAAPLAADYTTTIEGGYRGVTMICGLAVLLFALRILDAEHGYGDFVALGIFAGLGWWSLPEVVYFALPAALILGGAIVRSPPPRLGRWATRLGAAAAAFLLAALPWIWANVQSGLASLDTRKFPGTVTPLNPGFAGRLRLFFDDTLLLQLNLRRVDDGRLLLGAAGSPALHRAGILLLVVVVLVVVAAALVGCVLAGGRALAIAAAVVAYPFVVAFQPGTWYWIDGRYTVYTGTLLALALVAGTEGWHRLLTTRSGRAPNRAWPRAVVAAVVLGSLALSVADFHQSFGVTPASYASGWGDPNRPTLDTLGALERAGIRTAYADYWVAYKLDLLADGHVAVTVAGTDPDRSSAINRTVETSHRAAWLFVAVSREQQALAQFGVSSGPSGVGESTFTAALRRQGIGYRVEALGLLDAVLPSRPVRLADDGSVLPAA